KDVAVYALSSRREVGVDVEAVRTLPDADDVAARWFSPREYATYRALEPGDRALGFFQCWTRKEAFIKALGDGLFHPLDRFDVSLAPAAAISRHVRDPENLGRLARRSLPLAPGGVLARARLRRGRSNGAADR